MPPGRHFPPPASGTDVSVSLRNGGGHGIHSSPNPDSNSPAIVSRSRAEPSPDTLMWSLVPAAAPSIRSSVVLFASAVLPFSGFKISTSQSDDATARMMAEAGLAWSPASFLMTTSLSQTDPFIRQMAIAAKMVAKRATVSTMPTTVMALPNPLLFALLNMSQAYAPILP